MWSNENTGLLIGKFCLHWQSCDLHMATPISSRCSNFTFHAFIFCRIITFSLVFYTLFTLPGSYTTSLKRNRLKLTLKYFNFKVHISWFRSQTFFKVFSLLFAFSIYTTTIKSKSKSRIENSMKELGEHYEILLLAVIFYLISIYPLYPYSCVK